MTIGIASSPTLPTTLQHVSNGVDLVDSPHVKIAMPEAPKELMAGRWEEFQSAIQTHRGARNAALIGHVVNVIAKTAALGMAIATMHEDWKGYVDIPLHTVSAATQIANLLLAVSKFRNGPEDIPGAEIRNTNVFETLGQWTGVDFLREYGGVVNMAVTNGPLVFGAIHNGAAPLLETLGISVPAWLKDAANENASTAIADGVATATDFVQNKVLGTIIDGRERRASVDRVVAAEATVNYVVLEGDGGYVHMGHRPTVTYDLEGVTVVPRMPKDNAAQPGTPADAADVQSVGSNADEEFFDAVSDTVSFDSDGSLDTFHDALDTVKPELSSRASSPV